MDQNKFSPIYGSWNSERRRTETGKQKKNMLKDTNMVGVFVMQAAGNEALISRHLVYCLV